MNHIYKSLYNKALGTWVAVPEIAKTHGKSAGGKSAVFTLPAPRFAITALAGALLFTISGQQALAADYVCIDPATGQPMPPDSVQGPGSEVACGEGAIAAGRDSIAIGVRANTATGAQSAIAIGTNSNATQQNAFAFGNAAAATGATSLAVGNAAKASGQSSAAFGDGANASAGQTTAVGVGAAASAAGASAFGHQAKASKDHALATGSEANASGLQSFAGGYQAAASGEAAIAIGSQSKASHRDATAIGKAANAAGQDGIAVGLNANAAGQGVVAIGTRAGLAPTGVTYVAPTDAVFIGSSAGHGSNNNRMQIAIGNNAGKDVGNKGGASTENIAIGNSAGMAANGNTNVAISSRAGQNVTGHDNFAALVEAGQNVKGTHNIAIGKRAGRSADAANPLEVRSTIALGSLSEVGANNAIAIGGSEGINDAAPTAVTKALGKSSIAIGKGSHALAENTIAIGVGNIVRGANSGAFGDPSIIDGTDSYSVGNNNTIVTGTNNIFAFGNSITADVSNSVYLGSSARATSAAGKTRYADGSVPTAPTAASTAGMGNVTQATVGGITYSGFAGTSPTGLITLGASGLERRIQNLAAGEISATSTDAINGSQLFAVANTLQAGQTHYYSVNDNGTPGDNYNNDGALGQNSMAAGIAASTTNVARSSVAMGHGATVDTERGIAIGHNASAGGQQTANIAIGDTASAGASGAVVLGTQAKSDNTGYNSIVIGTGAKAEGTVSNRVTDVIVLGTGATANAASNIAIGFGAKSDSKSDAVSIGRLANAKGNISIAFGQGAKTSDNAGKSVAVGDQAETQASFGVALGSEAQVKTGAFYGVALGQGAKAQHRDAVALGSGAETAVAVSTNNATVEGITYGGFAGNTAHSTISVGSDSRKRTITNVAAGRINATSTDAINGSQLFATQTVIGNVASTTATHLGGGATVGADGKISEPSYNVTDAAGNTVGTTANNVGAALVNLNTYVNSGFDVQGNGTTQGTVSPTEKINFINGTGTTAVVSQETNGVTNITFNVNAQNLAESAQLPVVYTDGFGNKVYKHTDGNFYDQPNGAGTQIAPGDIVATMQAADGSVTTPTALTNVAAGANDTDAVNVSQLKGAAAALGGGATVNPDGSFKAPEYTLTNGDPSTGNTATYNTVGDALAGLNTAVNQPLTFGGDTGTAFSRRLGSTVNVKGGATGNLTDGNIGVEASNGTLNVKLAENIDLGASGSVKMGDTTVNSGGVTIANTDPAKTVSLTGSGLNNGGNKITNVAAGTADTDAVNFGQLKNLRDTVNSGWNIGNGATAPVGAVTPGKRVDFVAGNTSTKVEVTQNATTGNSEVKISAAPSALQYTDTNTAAGGNTPVDPFTPTNQVTLVGAGGNTSNGVTINNVAPAELSTTSKQAVNGSQLYDVGNSTAKALGGTSSFNPTTGQVTAGLSVGGNNYTTVQSALNAINTNITASQTHYYSANDGGVQQGNYNNNGATGGNAVAAGVGTQAGGISSTAIGHNANAAGNASMAAGWNSQATGSHSMALGGSSGSSNTTAAGDSSMAIGFGAQTESGANWSMAQGDLAKVEQDAERAMAIGTQATVKANADGATALGSSATVDKADGVALGSNSVADRAATPAGAATSDTPQAGQTVYATADATQADKDAISATVKGDLGAVSVGNDGATRQITNVAAGSADTDAVNVAQLKAVAKRPAVVNNITNIINNTTVSAGDNMQVVRQGDNYQVTIAPDISLNSVTTGPVTMDSNGLSINGNTYVDANGLNANGQTIRNVGAGRVAPDSMEAVNGAQLHALGQHFDHRVGNLENALGDVDKRARAGIASAMASAGLPQAYRPGASMVAASAGHYDGQTAIAIGASTISDNGRWILKGTLNVNSKDAGATVGVGYQW